MTIKAEMRAEAKHYTVEIDVSGQNFTIRVTTTRFGYVKAEILLPDRTIYPPGKPFFSTEDEALAAALRTAQKMVDVRHSMEGAR